MTNVGKGRDTPTKRVSRTRNNNGAWLTAWDQLADGQPHQVTMRGHNRALGALPPVLNTVDAFAVLCPFYKVERPDADTVIIHPLTELRGVLDDYRAGRNVPQATGVGVFARRIHDAIKSRREEFQKIRYSKAGGVTGDIQNWRHYRALVEWVEAELANAYADTVPTADPVEGEHDGQSGEITR